MSKCIIGGKLVNWPNGTMTRLADEMRKLIPPKNYNQELDNAKAILLILKGIVNSNDANNDK
jgi:hypothetical protein